MRLIAPFRSLRTCCQDNAAQMEGYIKAVTPRRDEDRTRVQTASDVNGFRVNITEIKGKWKLKSLQGQPEVALDVVEEWRRAPRWSMVWKRAIVAEPKQQAHAQASPRVVIIWQRSSAQASLTFLFTSSLLSGPTPSSFSPFQHVGMCFTYNQPAKLRWPPRQRHPSSEPSAELSSMHASQPPFLHALSGLLTRRHNVT